MNDRSLNLHPLALSMRSNLARKISGQAVRASLPRLRAKLQRGFACYHAFGHAHLLLCGNELVVN